MALKIKDGLFLGDAETSYDPEFLELNKVSNLVNLAGHQIQNIWAAHGLVYLTYPWEDRPSFRIFSDKETDWDGTQTYPPPLGEIVEFIDGSLRHGISVLVFSAKGSGRCVLACCAYLMCKYQWSYNKAMELILSKKRDIVLNSGFVQQLHALEKYLLSQRGGLRNDRDSANTAAGADSNGVGATLLDGMCVTLNSQQLARWKDWNVSYLPPVGTAEAEEPDNEEERIIINSLLNSRHNSFAAQMILPLNGNRNKLKFHKVLARVQDGSVINVPVAPELVPSLQLRSCLRGKAGKKIHKPAFVEPEMKYGDARDKHGHGHASLLSTDLYGFVGVEGHTLSAAAVSPHPVGYARNGTSGGSNGGVNIRPSSAPLQRSGGAAAAVIATTAGLTVEERLQQMIRGIDKDKSKDNEKGNAWEHQRGGDRDRDRDINGIGLGEYPVESKQGDNNSGTQNAPSSGNMPWDMAATAAVTAAGGSTTVGRPSQPTLSLYDLANMPLHTSNPVQSGSRRPGFGSPAASRGVREGGGATAPIQQHVRGPSGAFPQRPRPMSAQIPREQPQQAWGAGAKEEDPLEAFGQFGGIGGRGGGDTRQAQPQHQNRGGPVRPSSGSRRAGHGHGQGIGSGNRDRDRDADSKQAFGLEGRGFSRGGSVSSINSLDSKGNGSVGNASYSSRSSNNNSNSHGHVRLTPRKGDTRAGSLGQAEPKKSGWR